MGTIQIVGIIVVAILGVLFLIGVLQASSAKGIEKRITKMGNILARSQNSITKNNEEILKETTDTMANIHKDAIKTTVQAVKEGLTDEKKVYCKYCGSEIDADSKFCKNCGKEI